MRSATLDTWLPEQVQFMQSKWRVHETRNKMKNAPLQKQHPPGAAAARELASDGSSSSRNKTNCITTGVLCWPIQAWGMSRRMSTGRQSCQRTSAGHQRATGTGLRPSSEPSECWLHAPSFAGFQNLWMRAAALHPGTQWGCRQQQVPWHGNGRKETHGLLLSACMAVCLGPVGAVPGMSSVGGCA